MPPIPNGFALDQFDNSSALIDRWRLQRLALRKRLLQLISSQLTSATVEEQQTCLEHLCSELIDYISIGHFGIYGHLLRRHAHANQEVQTLTSYLYRCIGSSTDFVLHFNAICERSNVVAGSKQMREAIGKLTRSLLVRFALEEQMLELSTDSEI